MLKRLLLATAIAGALATPAFADSFDIDLNFAPPAPRYEVVPAPRPGYNWAAGYWGWEGRRHVWHQGRWVQARPGYVWVSDRWVHHGNRWGHAPGHWQSNPHWDHNQDWRHNDWDHNNDHGGWNRDNDNHGGWNR